MKSYLLDTHILLWWLADDKHLPKKIKALIADSENDIWVSSVTIWEMMIKKSLNRLEAPDDLKEILEENDIQILPMNEEHAFYVKHLPLIHQDPFDRILIAQCVVEDFIFVTGDEVIKKYDINYLS